MLSSQAQRAFYFLFFKVLVYVKLLISSNLVMNKNKLYLLSFISLSFKNM